MSRAEDDEIERMLAEPAPELPSLILSGHQRRDIARAIKSSIAEHQRNVRTKVVRDRQRITDVITALSRSLASVEPVEPRKCGHDH